MYVCTDPATHGHHTRWATSARPARKLVVQMTEQEREAARAERRDMIDANKAWDSATTVRRNWLRTYLARKTAPKGTAGYLATSAAEDADTLAATAATTGATPTPRTSRYLTHLATLGYTLSPVEERAREYADPDDSPSRTDPAAGRRPVRVTAALARSRATRCGAASRASACTQARSGP